MITHIAGHQVLPRIIEQVNRPAFGIDDLDHAIDDHAVYAQLRCVFFDRFAQVVQEVEHALFLTHDRALFLFQQFEIPAVAGTPCPDHQ